uniref:DUF725 domain-containing protein n=1 Tax=Gongylonema pulchrum TaxID=637853 RepID=A0A183DSY4_9BILA
LEDCEKTSEHSASIRQTYAGLRYEPVAMSRCQNEINQSLVGSNAFTAAVMNREQHTIRNKFGTLCRDLADMIRCIEPVTRNGCGEQAAQMMLNFEQLYNHLGITDQLPLSCRQLLNLTSGNRINNDRRLSAASHTHNSYLGIEAPSDRASPVAALPATPILN